MEFEAIYKTNKCSKCTIGANAETDTVVAVTATANSPNAVTGNDDIEVVRCDGHDLSVHIPKPIIHKYGPISTLNKFSVKG